MRSSIAARSYLAFDIGEAGSGTAACGVLSRYGRAAYLARVRRYVPNLDTTRAKRDGADYLSLWSGGVSCAPIRGRTVPVKAFVADVRADLAGANVRLAVCRRIQGRRRYGTVSRGR